MAIYKYTQAETRIIDFIRSKTEKGETAHIDEIINDVYPCLNRNPKHPRGSIAAIIRNLIPRMIINGDTPIKRVSKLGPKNKAEYIISTD